MDDLVKRLRSQFSIEQVRDNPTFVASTYEEERDEAANRIEQLEETMRWVLGTIGHDHPAKKVIRAALGEKNDG
jgi:hypothetical protein